MLLLVNYLVTLTKDTTDQNCLWAICISGILFNDCALKKKIESSSDEIKANMLYSETAVMGMFYKAV